MVVWDVPEGEVAELGRCLSNFEFVTLCYRRPRQGRDWPYNLFCMIHGHDREEVRGKVRQCGYNAAAWKISRIACCSAAAASSNAARIIVTPPNASQ